MGQGYQDRDWDIVDYQLWHLEGIPRPFRGPRPLNDGNNGIVCVGAAQTFGCYTDRPFPLLVQEAMGMSVLNMGVAGAGHLFFTSRHRFLERINRAKLAVIQVMSGRSESNSLFASDGGEMLTKRSDQAKIGAAPAYRELLKHSSPEVVKNIIHETRHNWIRHYLELFQMIEIPKILFWFSERKEDFERNYSNVHAFFGQFPQLVRSDWIDEITPYVDEYVSCVSSRGMPQQLINRFTGKKGFINKRSDLGGGKKLTNDYYPSPEMHIDAAQVLIPVCRRMLEQKP